jgi:23S rRNA (cytidine1920-2'-O)/16S rRNA (cytidine1409-2'-O)-methyltransferase
VSQRPRLDVLLVQRGLVETRERAQSLILRGRVRVEGVPQTKPGTRVAEDVALEVEGGELPVSRGALKLAGGRARLGLEVAGRVVLDAGASTGGFTEHLLEAGARQVFAVDVGYGQLAWKLRQDPRVVVMERTNVRTVEPERFQPRPEVLVADLSFISLAKVLPNLGSVLVAGAPGLVLVKPQFEAGPRRVEKGGLVRRPEVHRAILAEVLAAVRELGWSALGLVPSPIRGATGNLEFLLKLRAPGECPRQDGVDEAAVEAAVAEGHRAP